MYVCLLETFDFKKMLLKFVSLRGHLGENYLDCGTVDTFEAGGPQLL